MHKRRIGVLMGGLSSERDVSMETGQAVLAALRQRGCDARPIIVDRSVDRVLRQEGIELAFLALHGRYGEDGSIQGLLELLGIPYTGSGVLASALAMNKVKAKQIFRLHNLPTPSFYTIEPDRVDLLEVHGDFGFPVVVKPVNEGSSVGVAIVADPAAFAAAVERAAAFDREIMVERYIEGVEISVGVLNDRAIGAVEIVPRHPGFYDYRTKYQSGDCDYYVPPRLSPERLRGVLTQGLLAHRALGCRAASRVDMIVSPLGNEYVLEVNTLPGMTRASLLPKIAAAAGLSFEELVAQILLAADGDALAGNDPRRGTTETYETLQPAPLVSSGA
jgi:D-alanine-D-alanine ligase